MNQRNFSVPKTVLDFSVAETEYFEARILRSTLRCKQHKPRLTIGKQNLLTKQEQKGHRSEVINKAGDQSTKIQSDNIDYQIYTETD